MLFKNIYGYDVTHFWIPYINKIIFFKCAINYNTRLQNNKIQTSVINKVQKRDAELKDPIYR